MNIKDQSSLKFAIYARKSNEDEGKQILSIESQLLETRKFADMHQLNIVHEFTDEGSAHKPYNRQNFMIMMKQISKGEIDGILTWKADRLARNMIEGGQVIHLLQSNVIKIIQTQHSCFTPSDNMMMLTIELGMANQFSLDLSKNVKRGNKTKIEKGGWCSVAPHGYLNDRLNKTVTKDPDRFEMVRKMWDYYLTEKYSLQEICNIATEQWNFKTIRKKKIGGNPIQISSLYNIFTNPFYYGRVKNGENHNWGIHEPMVTLAEFERVQQILCREGRKGQTSYEFPFSGLIKCSDCNSGITAETKVKYFCPKCRQPHTAKTPKKCKCGRQMRPKEVLKGNWYTYYRCTKKLDTDKKCTQKCVRAEVLENQVEKIFGSIEIDSDFEAWALKWLKVLNQEQFDKKDRENEMFQTRYQSAEMKIKRILDMRAEGEISKEEFLHLKEIAEVDRDRAKTFLEGCEAINDEWIAQAETALDFVCGLKERFKNGNTKEKKYIFSQIGSNFVLEAGQLHLEIDKPYLIFKKLESAADLQIEPELLQSKKGLEPDLDVKIPEWYPR